MCSKEIKTTQFNCAEDAYRYVRSGMMSDKIEWIIAVNEACLDKTQVKRVVPLKHLDVTEVVERLSMEDIKWLAQHPDREWPVCVVYLCDDPEGVKAFKSDVLRSVPGVQACMMDVNKWCVYR